MRSKTINYLEFFKIIGKSKRLLRTGWVREKIKDPESVAEHSFRVGMLAMVLTDKLGKNLDKNKLIKMALLHDIAEVITGDIVTERWDLVDVKRRREKEIEEKEGIRKIFDVIGQGDEYADIFSEMINRATPEAKVFWQFDKLEMALQALEYEKEQPDKNLEEFFLGVGSYYTKEPLIKTIFNDVIKNRKKEYQKSLNGKLKGKK